MKKLKSNAITKAAKIIAYKVIIFTSLFAFSQELIDAKKQLSLGNFNSAYLTFKKLAEDGNAEAQSELGLIYGEGLGVSKNAESSFIWHLKAASNGVTYSQYVVGDMYSNGIGVIRNDSLSRYWLEKAAESGNINSMINLSIIYSTTDYEKSYFWILKAKSIDPYFASKELISNIEKNLTSLQIEKISKQIK